MRTDVRPVPGRPRSERVLLAVRLGLLAAFGAVWLAPMAITLLTALKANSELFVNPPFALPEQLRLGNFREAWETGDLGTGARNSLVICIVKVPLSILLSAMAAFAFARYEFPFRRTLYAVVIAGALLPVQVALIPLFGLLVDLGLLNTLTGVILIYMAFSFPFQVFLLHGFFREIPIALDEAARLDGASGWRVFARIVLPLSKPVLATLFILDFVGTWNEFPIALAVLQQPEQYTVPLSLLSFFQQYSANYSLVTAAVVMGAIPALVVYVLLQRFFIAGLTRGAIRQ